MLEDDEDNLLDDLMNRTFTDSDDDSDPTFVLAKGGDGEDKRSSSKSKNESRVQDTLPAASDHHESSMDSKSNDATFVSTISTVDDTEESAFVMTEDDSTTISSNEEARTDPDSNKKPSAESTAQTNGTSKIGKESLNEPISDPVDAMMSKFVEMEQNGKLHLKKSGKNQHSRKKRNHSLTTSQENVNRQKPIKESKSQESINQL